MARSSALVLVVLTLVLVAACGRTPTLQGEWRATDSRFGPHSLVFHRDGTAIWRQRSEDSSTTFALRYAVDESVEPPTLTLTGFDRGPLQGKVLYGILEFEGRYALRIDAEAGEPGADPETVRPRDFSSDTVTYERVR
jgi:hypothetical protein